MRVKQLIEFLLTQNPDHELLGQYIGEDGLCPTGVVEAAKVPGNNTLVVIQVIPTSMLK